MSDEEAVQIHVLKALGKCPRLTPEMQARITWEALDPKNKNVVEAKRRLEGLKKDQLHG